MIYVIVSSKIERHVVDCGVSAPHFGNKRLSYTWVIWLSLERASILSQSWHRGIEMHGMSLSGAVLSNQRNAVEVRVETKSIPSPKF